MSRLTAAVKQFLRIITTSVGLAGELRVDIATKLPRPLYSRPMHRLLRKLALPLCALTSSALTAGLGSSASADGPRIAAEEVREFEILVKDKPAGTSTIRITNLEDGTTRVATDVKVKLNYLVYVYRYEFHGDETWRGDRLMSAENRATDDGKEFAARLVVNPGGSSIEANGRSRRGPVIAMTTNYWRTPNLAQGTKINLMNGDRGTVHSVTIGVVGQEQIVVDRQVIECAHYRLGGDLEAELWFDPLNRIVRQKSVEDGYPTEVRLTRISAAPTRTAQR